jgi:hypothetical protein
VCSESRGRVVVVGRRFGEERIILCLSVCVYVRVCVCTCIVSKIKFVYENAYGI